MITRQNRTRSTAPRGRSATAALIREAERANKKLTERFDSWINNRTAAGTSRDKRTHTVFETDIVTDTEARGLWLGDDICRKVIEAKPVTAFRRGVDLNIEDKDLAADVKSDLEELEMLEKTVQALCYENAYGGSAIFPVTDDSDDLSTPLNMNAVNKLEALHVLEPRQLAPVSYYRDLKDPKLNQPKIWRFTPLGGNGSFSSSAYIHESRLITFPGRKITEEIMWGQRPGWGFSSLCGVYSIIRDFGSAWSSASALLHDFAQGVLKMDGYSKMMESAKGREVVQARLAMVDLMRSVMRFMAIDKNDDFTRTTTPMGGLSDLLHDFALRVAAAAEQPVTVMFGMAPAGLQATGDNDIRGWYDTVAAWRQNHVLRKLRNLVRLYMLSKDSATGGEEPDGWSLKFPQLWEPTDKEVADTRLVVAQADQIYWNIGSATDEDIATSRWGSGEYSPEMTIDWKARKAQQDAEEEMAAEQQKAQQLALANGGGGLGPDGNPIPAGGDPNAQPPAQQQRTGGDPTPPPADEKKAAA